MSLLLAAFSLSAQPVLAQQGSPTWDITYSQSGSDDFTMNGHHVGPWAWGSLNDQYLMRGQAVQAAPGNSANIDGSGSITATLTWKPNGTGQAPPPKIYLAVFASASFGGTATGYADDGLGDPVVGGVSQGLHIKGPFDSSSGTVTFTLPLSCGCSVSVPVGGNPTFLRVGHSMSVGLDNRGVTISCPALDSTYGKQLNSSMPVDTNGDANYVPKAHVRAADGTMSGDVGLPITLLGYGPELFTNITYHANLTGSWQTANSSYNWFSSLKQQGDSGSLYPRDFTNRYLDPWQISSNTPGVPPSVTPGEADPSKNPDHIYITCMDGLDGAIETANYYMTLHPTMEKNYADHITRGIENLRKAPNASYVRATQNDSTLTVYAEHSDSWSFTASTDGAVGDFIAGILNISLSASYSYSYSAGVQASIQHVNIGYATYLEEFDAYKYHVGKVDKWSMSGYGGTGPYRVKEPDSPSGGYQAHSPPIYLGSGGTP